jgi:hypothetical protein
VQRYQAPTATLPISFNINLDHHLIGKALAAATVHILALTLLAD